MREQAQQPLDPRSRAPQVLGVAGIVERLSGGDQQLLLGRDLYLASASRG